MSVTLSERCRVIFDEDYEDDDDGDVDNGNEDAKDNYT